MIEKRRNFIKAIIPACALACVEANNIFASTSHPSKPVNNKEKQVFQMDICKSYEEDTRQKYLDFIRIMKKIGEYMGEDKIIKMVNRANDETILPNPSPDPNFNFREWNAKNDELYKHVAIWKVLESNNRIHKLKVSECLFANIFREHDAVELGYATNCRMADLYAKMDHSKITAIKTKTLMRGDAYCDSTWIFNG